jgi:type IV pilus assembly protein PilA
MSFFIKRNKGFTLVELLIVVAIIGVLSTIGVPTFRRMIQKSKKSEAKVNLGGVYTSEAAFNAEYNYYGNNLTRMGYEIDGSPSALIYTVGFFGTNCANQTTILPTNATAFAAINAAFPAYYNVTNTRMGNVSSTVCGGTAFNSSAAGDTFTAGAVGMIAPPSVTRSNTTLDIWTINETRALSNSQDGTN